MGKLDNVNKLILFNPALRSQFINRIVILGFWKRYVDQEASVLCFTCPELPGEVWAKAEKTPLKIDPNFPGELWT